MDEAQAKALQEKYQRKMQHLEAGGHDTTKLREHLEGIFYVNLPIYCNDLTHIFFNFCLGSVYFDKGGWLYINEDKILNNYKVVSIFDVPRII